MEYINEYVRIESMLQGNGILWRLNESEIYLDFDVQYVSIIRPNIVKIIFVNFMFRLICDCLEYTSVISKGRSLVVVGSYTRDYFLP